MSAERQSLHVVFIRVGRLIKSGFDGGTVTSLRLVEYLLDCGHTVSYVYTKGPNSGHVGRTVDSVPVGDSDHQDIGIREAIEVPFSHPKLPEWAESIPGPLGRILRSLLYRWQKLRIRKNTRNLIEMELHKLAPDVCFIFSEVIEYFPRQVPFPVVGWVPNTGEPYKEIAMDLGDWSFFGNRFLTKIAYKLWLLANHRLVKKRVRKLNIALCPSPFYGEVYKRLLGGRPPLRIFSHPAIDESSDLSNPNPEQVPANEPYDIVLVGALVTSLAKANAVFLFDEILPELARRNLGDRFRFSLIGRFDPPQRTIEGIKKYPTVRVEGFVENLADRINRADAVLHAVKYPPSAGMRLCSFSSMYACLVLHEAARTNFPELFEGEACVSAQTGAEFVDALLKVCEDRDLNQSLRQNARAVYDQYYDFDRFGAVFENTLYEAVEMKSPHKQETAKRAG